MRQARIREEGRCYYHCLSRVVDGRFIFGEAEKEHFVNLMRRLERFHGIRVVTYCVMSNHFHLLVEEPDREETAALPEETVLARVKEHYDSIVRQGVEQELERARAGGHQRWEKEILDRYRDRMGDVSQFMKELKQGFSQWYNRRNRRRGTLWEDRYKSLLVEGDEKALLTMAAYIDLNPVRARMVEKVEDYRWCGYGAAVGGVSEAREGLGRILASSAQVSGTDFERNWKETSGLYRCWLYDQGEHREIPETGQRRRRGGFEEEEVQAEAAREGQLTLGEVLRCRVRYFADGAVLGSAAYVDRIFEANRERFGRKRKTGARPMQEADWGGLCVLRDLRGVRVG